MMGLLGFGGSALVVFREILESVDIQPQQVEAGIGQAVDSHPTPPVVLDLVGEEEGKLLASRGQRKLGLGQPLPTPFKRTPR